MACGSSKAEIEVAIERMRKKVAALDEKYKSTRDADESAWNTYGSELCAGHMGRAEKDILGQKAELEIAIGIWEEVLASGVDIETKKQAIEAKSKEVKDIIDHQKLIVADCEAELKRIELAKSFLPR